MHKRNPGPARWLVGLALLATLTGCSRSAPGLLGEAGWRDAEVSDRASVASLLRGAAEANEQVAYRVEVRHGEGTVEIARLAGVVRYRFALARDGEDVPVEVYQYDPADTLHFPRSIVCAPDRELRMRCRDVTLDVIGDYLTEEPLEKDFHGLAFDEIFVRTHIGVQSPAHWRTISGLAHTPLNLTRSVGGDATRLGLDDRLYITAVLRTPQGDATCVAWFDSAEEFSSGSVRGGWCQNGGVWFGDTRSRVTAVDTPPAHMHFPAPVELPAVSAKLSEQADMLAEPAFPEFPDGFFASLRQTPVLP